MKDNIARSLEQREEQQVVWAPVHGENEEELVGVHLRALNPDNHREAEQLVLLLSSYYGTAYPCDGVYDPEFWCTKLEDLDGESRIVSIVAETGGSFIAHIALRYDTTRNYVEIFLPAIHADFRRQLFSISRAYWALIESMAQRQGWKSLYQYTSTSESALQIISAKCFNSYEMAIFPDAVTCSSFRNREGSQLLCRRNTALLMMHYFNPSGQPPRRLYPPAEHHDKIKDLYSPLHLHRTFLEAPRAVAKLKTGKFASEPTQTTLEKIQTTFDERFSLHHIRIIPSELPSHLEALSFVNDMLQRSEAQGHRLCIGVALDDPRCPPFCTDLEVLGFRLAGVIPGANEHDYVLFSKYDRPSVEDLTLYTPRGRALRDYLLRQN